MLKTFTLTLLCASALAAQTVPPAPAPAPKVQVPYSVFVVGSGTCLKLDTRTGQIWQIQYAQTNSGGYALLADPANRSQKAVSPTPLADGTLLGRFNLQQDPGQSAFVGAFVLLDQIDGRVWLIAPPVKSGDPYTFTAMPDPL